MNIIVDKKRIAVDVDGEGQVVLMLHGWGSDRRSFSIMAKKLSVRFKVVRIDLPGFGESQAPKDAWAVENYVDFVAVCLNKLKIEKVYTVIGHSMGGRIAIQGLGRGIFDAPKLVLIGSHGIKESSSARNKAFKVVAKIGRVVTSILPLSLQRRLRSKLYDQAGASDYLSAGNMKETFKKIINNDVQEDAVNVKAKTLLIYGENDRQTPVSFGETFSGLIPKSRLMVIESAGHFPHIDKPQEVDTIIEGFLADD